MKTIVKVLCVLMCLLMALSVLSACNKKGGPDNPSDNTDTPVDNPVDQNEDPNNGEDPNQPIDNPVDNPTDPVDDPNGREDLLDDIMQAKYPDKEVIGIAYPEDLLALMNIVNNSANVRALTKDTVYYLAGDIDLNPYWVAETTVEDGEIYTPFAPSEACEGFFEFYGIFDGNGHTISGLYIVNDDVISYDSIGFFGDLHGSVRDLTLENCFICGKTEMGDFFSEVSIGALAGRLIGDDITIENVSVKSSYVVFESGECPYMGGVIGTIDGEDNILRSVSFEGSVILAAANTSYPSPAKDVILGQIVGSADGNSLLMEDCVAGGFLFGAEPEEDKDHFCADGDTFVELVECRVESPIVEPDPEGVISIRNKRDLLALDPNRTYAGVTIRLMNDIDLNPGWSADAVRSEKIEIPDTFWNSLPAFAGTFDGQGHRISGLCVFVDLDKSDSYFVGSLVDLLKEGATIQNLTIDNSAIFAYTTSKTSAGSVRLAGAIGRAETGTTIKDVILDVDLWTLGNVTGYYSDIQAYDSAYTALTVENSYFIGDYGKLDLSVLSRLFDYMDPYDTEGYDDEIIEVSNAAELMAVMTRAQGGETFDGKTVRLTANIDLNPGVKVSATIDTKTGGLVFPDRDSIVNEWLGIPVFKGMFDGNGYAISGLYSWRNAISENSGSYGGLIDSAEDYAIIKNLVIRNSLHVVNNTGDGAWGAGAMRIGGLVGSTNKARGAESNFSLTISNVYVDMDVILLSSNHATVGGLLAFAVRHEKEKDADGETLKDYTAAYRIENVAFAGRVINSDYTLKVPFTSPKDQFFMSQIVASSNWGSTHRVTNVLAAGEIICGNTTNIRSFFGGYDSHASDTAKGVICTNAVTGRYTTTPKACFTAATGTETSPFSGVTSWIYDHELGFYLPQKLSKMIADNGMSEILMNDLDARGLFNMNAPSPNEIHVSTAEELIALVSSGEDFKGQIIYLDADIDFNPGWSAATTIVDGKVVFPDAPGVTWTAFATFKGKINGQGHTISGLYSKRTVADKKGSYGLLIDNQYDGYVKNLAIVNSILLVENNGGDPAVHDLSIGGLVGQINKTTVKSADAGKDKYALGNSENYGLTIQNFFTDMEVWLISKSNALVGGLIGSANAKYTIEHLIYAGKLGNTNAIDGTGPANYAAASNGSNLAMGQIIGWGGFKDGVYLQDAIVVGQIITGTSSSYIHTYVGADDTLSRGRCNTILFADVPEGGNSTWVRSENGFNVPKSILAFANRYRAAMVIDNNNTLTGLTLQPKKDPLNSLTIASSVAIPDNVTVIADSAFEGCHLLESVTLPSGLISIGEKAFYQCVNLASTALPNSVVSIGDNAFTGCFALPYETYDNAIYLGNDSNPYIALLRATSKDISSCTIHKDAQFVSSFAFANCSNLTTITLPSGVSAIGANAFEGCIALTSITFPSSVKHIGAHAFKDCTGLIALEIPSGVTSIGQGIFYGCTNLSSLTISSDNSVYKALGNCVIEKTSNVLVAGCANGTIPSNGTVTSIADEAFSGCYGVTSIVIPANVAKIGSKAFSDCKDLTQVTIPYTVTSIGKNAFSGCEKLAKVIYTSSAANWDDVSKVSDEWSSTLIEYTEAPENLIHVKTAGELIDLANSGDTFRWKTIYLDNDIDFNPGWSARAQIVGEKLSLPSQPENTWTAFENFMGTIDGQGHSISGLYTQRTVKGNKGSYGGLIDTASNGAIIKNLIIQNSIYVVENTSWGTTNIYVGGLVAKCDKTTSDNHYNALIISNVYVDMDIVWHCDEQCTLGGILGYAVRHDDKYTSPYNISNTVFAGRIINTNSSYTVPYASQEDKKFSMAQIVANTNWGSQHVLSNVLAAGEIISGNLGDSSVNAIFGSATATGVKQTNVVEGRKIELPASGWIYNDEIGYYVPESVYKLLQPYELAIKLANGNTAFAGFKLQLKDSTDPTNITRSTAGISVTIPEGVTTIYPRAFESVAPILESVTLPNTVISISAFAFEGCTALGTVTLPDALGSIGNSAFEGCTNLKVPAIPANVQVIGASAFKGCTSLTNLTLDNDGTVNLTIGDHAFEGCTGLKVNTIPAKVANIGMNAFKDCPNLTDLEFGYDGSANFDVGANAFDKIEILHVTPAFLFRFRNDDTMMKKNVTTIYVTSGDLLDKNYVVNYPKLTLINMPTITTINAGAFGNCPNLTGAGVTIPASVTTIEEGAFRNMSGILAYVVEAGNANYQVIGGDLYTADGATLLAYAAGKTDAAFAIPTTVTKIGAYAFNACKATTFTYADTMEVFDANVTVDKDAFDEPTLITCTDGNTCGVHTVVIDTEAVEPTCTATGMTKASHCSICGKIVSTATEIPALGHSYHPTTHKCIRCGALEPVAGLSYVSKGDGTCYVAGLGGYTSKDVTIDATSPAGDKVIAIADFAFANTAITSISIPTTVKTIGKGAFMNCSSLVITTSTVASGNEGGYTSDENAIYANDGKTLVRVGANKTTFTVGKDVTLIEDYAFAGCAKLTSVSVNNKNSYYKTSNNAIYTKLANGDLGDTLIRARNSASVTITAGTVHIAPGAFAGCNKLTSITLLATIEDIGDYAFYGCSALTSVTNNASDLKHVGTDAFTGTQVAAPPTGSAD